MNEEQHKESVPKFRFSRKVTTYNSCADKTPLWMRVTRKSEFMLLSQALKKKERKEIWFPLL